MSKLLLIILKSKIREPLEFFWNLFFPLAIFATLNFSKSDNNINLTNYYQKLIPFLTWMTIQNAIYSVGLNLLNWREMGFLKSIINTSKSYFNLIILFCICELIMSTFYFIAIYLFSSFILKVSLNSIDFILLYLGFFIANVLTSYGSTILNTLNFSYSSISSLISMLILPMVWLGNQNINLQENYFFSLINYLNPIYYLKYLILIFSNKIITADLSIIFFSIAFLLLGSIGVLYGITTSKLRR